MKEELKRALAEFVGKRCWSTVAGAGSGSIFTLGIGAKIPRENPLRNPHLSGEQQENDSEYGLMVYSSWVLKRLDIVVCNSANDNSNDGPLVLGLRKLEGKEIKKAE